MSVEETSDATRRSFLKRSAKGALLLPYVAPAIETIMLSEASAEREDDEDESTNTSDAEGPSPIGNEVPQPPGNTNTGGDEDVDSGKKKRAEQREFGEPKKRDASNDQ